MSLAVANRERSATWMVVLALGIVYVVWGSTYLAIRIMVDDMPPLVSAGARYLAATAIMAGLLALKYGWRRLAVTPGELAGCALLGVLLPAGGNGLVTVAEQRGAPSGIAALLVAAVPLWVVCYRFAAGDRPSRRTLAGVLLGFAGLAYLIGASGFGGQVKVTACLIIVVASLSWSFGSWFQARLALPADPFVTTTYEMLTGGAVLLAAGLGSREPISVHAYSGSSWLAWGYLVTFGTVVAFSAYVWVLSKARISLVATYAYVNPVVAVFLGWLVLSEPLTWPVLIGGAVVVGAVAIVVGSERARPASGQQASPEQPATSGQHTAVHTSSSGRR
jgi:drug/metabolite transporter (DMT)-like permease